MNVVRAANRGWCIRRRAGRAVAALTAAVAMAAAGLVAGAAPASAATCSPNLVVCENSQPGTPASEWDISGAGDETLQGFAADMSVNVGGSISFKIQAQQAYTIDIYRLGWYGGNGARKITRLPGTFPAQNQTTECVTDNATQIFDCGTWAVSATWAVPATAVSGVYLAVLTRTDNGNASHIPFVVRDDASTSQVVFKTSDATWQAYNTYGGANFYSGPNGRATKLSYNRPFATRDLFDGRDYLFSNEYPMIRFLERNGYDVSYITDVDADRRGDQIRNHNVFLSVGHDEYWSGPQRAAVEAARDAGTSLAFFSGNEVYWKTRWENSQDGHNTDHRTLVCYKETWANAKSDPSPEWTGTYRDPRFSPPSNGGRPENALTGVMFMSNSDDLALQVPAAEGKYRFWRNTGVANLAAGQTATLAPHTIGYESDEDVDNGFRPAGLIRLSTTTGDTPEYLRDFGSEVTPGTTTHHLTLYRAPSGALVFGAGTIQWAWGLDDNHDSGYDPIAPADPAMQQATINLLADMGVQPATRMSGTVAATKSTDTAGPTVTITSPAAGASFANGTKVTVQGTATDSGGRVAGIEVSTDGGATWHPATGTESWSYSYYATGDGSSTVNARATDDSANVGATASRQVALTGSTSLFGDRVPANPAANDASAVELGVKVVPQTDGFIKGVRFYKDAGNTGTHNGSLWSVDGDLLATGTFTGETATGWQTLIFSPPVPVIAGTAYLASYTAPNGHYAADPWFFSYAGHVAAPLSAPRNHEAGGNGVFGNPGQFPSRTFQAANYYVDVLFDSATSSPPQVSTVTPTPGALYVLVSTRPTVTFNKPVDGSTIQFTLSDAGNASVGGSVSYDSSTRTATFTPSSALAAGRAFTATVQATDTYGNPMKAPKTWTFTTDPGNTTINRLFEVDAVPAVAAVNDSDAVSLGVKFTPSADGSVIGIRYYKGAGNGGIHTGSLWSSTGTRLATATFSDESSTGWQTVYFAQAVSVTGGTQYVASYYAPRGHYAASGGFFASTWTNGPLVAASGANGVYQYGSDTFPTSSFGSSNYWVDPLFITAPAAPQPEVPEGSVTVFPSTATPVNANWNDPAAIEVGAKFTTDVAGVVNGVRFYKGAANGGTHTGSLWSSTGTLLATGTFVGETQSGWQTMLFSSPVTVTPGATYVVSYSSVAGRYAVDLNGLSAGANNAPLHIPPGGGLYKYGSGFPAATTNHNFWVDAVFTPNAS
ncbi:DUF4082 domain-containing protein [Planosporangium flavigriseum]|nr:DUF4082 domain-containing protein [Planosporangium flavigriseum]NJC65791.1 DUF4082 domain-containing protein [Planosporangium flavigriseum]